MTGVGGPFDIQTGPLAPWGWGNCPHCSHGKWAKKASKEQEEREGLGAKNDGEIRVGHGRLERGGNEQDLREFHDFRMDG